jgi:hypothetical protein
MTRAVSGDSAADNGRIRITPVFAVFPAGKQHLSGLGLTDSTGLTA